MHFICYKEYIIYILFFSLISMSLICRSFCNVGDVRLVVVALLLNIKRSEIYLNTDLPCICLYVVQHKTLITA